MATQYMTESRYPQMQLPSGFSIVVDDVDGDRETEDEVEDTPEYVEEAQEALEEGLPHGLPHGLPGVPCQCGSSHERRGSREPLDAQLCSERIRQIQVEAQSRKNEFAKLLEEHAQVVLRVKQMEQREQQLQHPEEQGASQPTLCQQEQAQPAQPAQPQQLIERHRQTSEISGIAPSTPIPAQETKSV